MLKNKNNLNFLEYAKSKKNVLLISVWIDLRLRPTKAKENKCAETKLTK